MIRKACAILDRAPELEPAIRRGELTVDAAFRQIKQRDEAAKLADIPADLVHYFAHDREFVQIGRMLDRIASRVDRLANERAGCFLDATAIRQSLGEIKKAILCKQPSAVCPCCEDRLESCWCKGTGVITAGFRRALEDEGEADE
jgi:hypothetical protein